MAEVNSQKEVIALLNERLRPHGVKCRDMTLLMSDAAPERWQQICRNVAAHPDRAVIVFNASDKLNRYLSLLGGPNRPFVFIHRDNYYTPSAELSFDQTIHNIVKTVTGTEDVCTICLEPIVIDKGDLEELGCGHRFHQRCLCPLTNNSRPETSFKCPLCRADFTVTVGVA
jgi:hypothetical protein